MKKLIFLLLTTFSYAQSVTKTINLLPDTGQNTSYTATVGEDNDYNINVPSYTDNGNGTITDNVTGLMWQKVDGGEMTFENAISYCDNLVFAGYSDWRLPTPLESFSIMNLQNSNPALNTTYFSSPTTPGADYWWTSTVQYGDATKVWCTNAGGGIGNKPKAETMSAGGTLKYNARAVRTVTTPTTITNQISGTPKSLNYVKNNDGLVNTLDSKGNNPTGATPTTSGIVTTGGSYITELITNENSNGIIDLSQLSIILSPSDSIYVCVYGVLVSGNTDPSISASLSYNVNM
jgi:hypothetical protein